MWLVLELVGGELSKHESHFVYLSRYNGNEVDVALILLNKNVAKDQCIRVKVCQDLLNVLSLYDLLPVLVSLYLLSYQNGI